MKSLTRVWWGSDQKTLMTMYKAIVRSHLDFGMTCIMKTSKANWNKLNNVQYQALRTALGCMKSTPIRALLAEAGETPLDIRRNWLAARICVKLLARTEDKITNQVINIYTLMLENRQYGRNYDQSALMEGTDQALHYNNQIYKDERLPCFHFTYHMQIKNLNFIKLNLHKEAYNEKAFINEIKEKASEYKLVFTDASVEPKSHACGIGIYSEDQNIQIYRKLRDHTAICTAETLAIREAIRIMGKRTDKLAVITDSLSALQAITKQGIDKDQDYITLSTREEIILAEQDCNIKLIWVPSHTGIAGNEQADRLAQKVNMRTQAAGPGTESGSLSLDTSIDPPAYSNLSPQPQNIYTPQLSSLSLMAQTKNPNK
nr:unnamed protein product [Callosobruchus analis]